MSAMAPFTRHRRNLSVKVVIYPPFGSPSQHL
jgi:hypothetical protein